MIFTFGGSVRIFDSVQRWEGKGAGRRSLRESNKTVESEITRGNSFGPNL